MPTAAKLVAAVFFAILSWVVADLYAQILPPATHTGLLRPVAAVMGVIWGWRVTGGLAGRGYGEAAANGLRTAVTIAFWTIFIFSVYDMILQATKMRYHGVMEALLAIFAIMLSYAALLKDVTVSAAGIGGGMVVGMIAEWASKRWS